MVAEDLRSSFDLIVALLDLIFVAGFGSAEVGPDTLALILVLAEEVLEILVFGLGLGHANKINSPIWEWVQKSFARRSTITGSKSGHELARPFNYSSV